MTKRILGAALVAVSAIGLLTPEGATAATPAPRPVPITRPGGLAPGETHALAGDCELDNVTCRPKDQTGSCSPADGVTTTAPPSASTPIRVLVRTPNTNTVTISSIPFLAYVQNVLPKEWVPTFDGDARKAGAIAVKSYAWYWMSHFGGYMDDNPTKCFDVTDDQDFQVYEAGSATTSTDSSISQTWPVFARKDDQVFQTLYRNYFTSTKEKCGTLSPAYPNQMSQYGSQNCNDADLGLGGSTANKYNVILQLYYGTDLQLATTAQLRTQHDFQYLHRSTEVAFNAGTWSVNDGYPTTIHLGGKGDIPVVNTVGDGFARVGVYRPSNHTYYVGTPTGSVASKVAFGGTGDLPVAAQYNSLTSPTQFAVFRPSNGTWYLANPNGTVAAKIQYGQKGDIPVPGRWFSAPIPADSKDSLAVFRPSTGAWLIRGGTTVHYGQQGDIPVPADYDGNGTTDVAVYRPSNHQFYVRGHDGVGWGVKGDVPVTGDFNGDGKADLAVYRPSNHTWYVRGISTTAYGSTGATPIGKAPYAD